MRFSHFFIDRPIFATVMSVILTIVGIIAGSSLPIAEYPEIAPPTVNISATYPGASAAVIAETVAAPIEQEVNGVDNMLYIVSQSTGDGRLSISVVFKPGTNIDQAQVLVQNRVSIAEPRLPEDVRRLGLTVLKASPDLMMVVHMISPDGTRDQQYISNYATLYVRDRLARIDGIGDSRVFGARDYSMRVWLDPAKVASRGLTASEVVAALRAANLQVAAGSINQPPASSPGAFTLSVHTLGRLSTTEEFENIVIRSGEQGDVVRVKDVARVELGSQDYTVNAYLSNKVATAVVLFQRPGSNALSTAAAVKAEMETLAKDFPPGVAYTIVYNPTDFIRYSIDAVIDTFVEALVLVVLVVILFLQTWRAAVIPIIAIPVSLVGAFVVMGALGISFNALSLFGLVLAIGIVVDDAIVVVENVERKLAEGFSPKEAAHQTMDEVGGALIAIALVLAAVFVPTAFIPGISGLFYQQFALTIAISTAISAFVSLTLSPALAARLLRGHDGHARRNIAARALGAVAGGFNRGFDATSRGYAASVGVLVRRKLLVLPIYAGLIAATVWTATTLPRGFIPVLDQGYAIIVAQLPDGASLARTDEVTRRISQIAETTPGADRAVAFSGFSAATFTNATNAAAVFVGFEPYEKRLKEGHDANEIIRNLFIRLQSIEEAFVIAIPPPPVRGIGNAGGFKLQVQERDGAGVERVLASAREMMMKARGNPNLSGVFTTFSAGSPQVFLDIDREKARVLGVPITAIFEALQYNFGTAYVNDFNAFGRVYQVRAQADQRFRVEREDISRLRVRSNSGALVPLGTLVGIREVTGPDLIQRYNMYTSVPLQGNAAPGVSSGQALEAMAALANEVLPRGMSFEWTELAFQEQQTGNLAIFIFGLSVLFVFLVLAAQYESWSLPLAIILIVPMSVLSALLGVMWRGMDNNILTQIGLVVLVGLAAKNAILIVEFARDGETRGKGPIEAVVEAARLRLRPIIMTALAFILGVVPLVLATGPGAEMRQSLGTAVFFGMTGVTFFGLFLTPVFYVTIRAIVLRFQRKTVTKEPLAPAQQPM
jgi:HAE1 family hydrophobic/amphiphilic exporter-1